MAKFSYQAKDETGRIVEGTADAADERQVASLLKDKHLVPIVIKAYSGTWDINEQWNKFQGVSVADKATFTRQLATMIAAGLPLTESLNILQNQVESKKLQQILAAALREVESGTQLSVALSRYPDVFPNIYLALLRAAEASGSMDKILLRLAEQMEQERDFRGKIRGALLYPAIVSGAMVLIGIAMMVLVIPRIAEVYDSVGAELPLPTVILIFTSKLVQFMLPFMPFMLIGAIIAFRRIKSSKSGGRFLSNLGFKLPVFGPLNKMVTFAIMVRTFGALVGSGLPILDGLRITRDTVGNNVYGEGLEQAAQTVEKGSRLSIPIQANKNFPPIIGQMIAIGEETGQLDEVLGKLAGYFEQESEQRIKNLTTALEPIMIIVMGVAVAGLALAILLPMFNLVNVIK
jgi:type IV pilus assembly protein PilC